MSEYRHQKRLILILSKAFVHFLVNFFMLHICFCFLSSLHQLAYTYKFMSNLQILNANVKLYFFQIYIYALLPSGEPRSRCVLIVFEWYGCTKKSFSNIFLMHFIWKIKYNVLQILDLEKSLQETLIYIYF